MTMARLPAGKAPEPRRERRTRREATAGTTPHPKQDSRVRPSVAPGATGEPAPPHRAAFWRHGPGSGARERCPPRVLWAALSGTGAAAIASGALATRISATAPSATAMPRHCLTGVSLPSRPGEWRARRVGPNPVYQGIWAFHAHRCRSPPGEGGRQRPGMRA